MLSHIVLLKVQKLIRSTVHRATPVIGQIAECVDITAMEFGKLAAFAKEKEIDLTIIGMDDPLVGGIVDVFEEQRDFVSLAQEKMQPSLKDPKRFPKIYEKNMGFLPLPMKPLQTHRRHWNIWKQPRCQSYLKADGLALGKGVLICNTLEEAKTGVKTLMLDKQFGDAGK